MPTYSYDEEQPRVGLRKALRWGEYFFLVTGFLCLAVVLFTMAQSSVYQSFENYRLEQNLNGREATIAGYVRSFFGEVNEAPMDADKRVAEAPNEKEESRPQPAARIIPEVPPGDVVGRIEIPRLGISAIVREGVDHKTLGRAVGHVPSTALPGASGNVAVAAHRDTFFRPVRDIRKGDVIRMVTDHGTYEYHVESMKIVTPRDVEVLDPTKQPMMTLVTCYPFNYIGSAPKRFIVRARQVTAEAQNREHGSQQGS